MRHEDYFSRLPTDFLRAIKFIQVVVYGIDRVTLWCDGQHAPLIPDNIYDACTNINVHPNDCKYHRSYPWKIDLLQPSRNALRLLQSSFGNRHRSKVIYVELACDFIVPDRQVAAQLMAFLLKHVAPKHTSQPVTFFQSTAYYSPRSNQAGKKTSRNLVIYADKNSKLHSSHGKRACCHIEWRLSGARKLEHVGIRCFADLISFPHRKFWRRTLPCYQLPKLQKIGEWLRDGNEDVGDAAHRKAAKKFLSTYRENDVTPLQNVVADNYDFHALLTRINGRHLFK